MSLTAIDIVEQLTDPDIRQLFTFWSEARADNPFPSQRDLDLPRIPRLLTKLFVIDRVGQTFRYRYVGSDIDRHIGQSVTGKLFAEIRIGRVLSELDRFYLRVVEEGVFGVLTTRLQTETNAWRTYRHVALPVADDHRSPNKAVGLFLMESQDEPPWLAPPIPARLLSTEEQVVSQFGAL